MGFLCENVILRENVLHERTKYSSLHVRNLNSNRRTIYLLGLLIIVNFCGYIKVVIWVAWIFVQLLQNDSHWNTESWFMKNEKLFDIAQVSKKDFLYFTLRVYSLLPSLYIGFVWSFVARRLQASNVHRSLFRQRNTYTTRDPRCPHCRSWLFPLNRIAYVVH